MSRLRDWRGWLLALSALIIALDRYTKHWVSQHIAEGNEIVVVQHVFAISHVQNPGAAFSMFSYSPHPDRVRWMLTLFSVLVAIVILIILLRIGRRATLAGVSLALILGGAIGNAWDRVAYGTVVDFLQVHIVNYHWPDFNVADSAIVIGGILLLIDSLRPRKQDQNESQAAHPDPEP